MMTAAEHPSASRAARSLRSRYGLLIAAAAVTVPLAGCTVGSLGERSHESREVLVLSADGPAAGLRVRNRVGFVRLVADPAAVGVTAEAELIGSGRSPEEAERALAEISALLSSAGAASSWMEASVTVPRSATRRGHAVNWTITAPPGFPLDVSTAVGDITVVGFDAGAALSADVGEIEARDIRGGVSARTDVGNIRIVASAPIDARADVGDVSARVLEGAAGPVSARTDVGSVRLSLPAGCSGPLTARTDVGGISLRHPGAVIVESSRDGRRVRATLGDGAGEPIDATTDVGSITIEAAGG